VPNRNWFSAAEARNLGAAATEPDAVLCFLDADVTVSPGFADAILDRFQPDGFLVPDRRGAGFDGALVCSRAAFEKVGGYDTNYHGTAEANADMRAVLARAGFVERTFPAALLDHRGGHTPEARDRFYPLPDAAIGAGADAAYRKLKDTIAAELGGAGTVPPLALREIHRAITHGRLVERGLLREAPSAAVAFHEKMGYTVAELRAGASSHNNDARPFEEIPSPLAGLSFTQVVASRGEREAPGARTA